MGTWIVGAIVLAVIELTGYIVYKDRKTGKGGGCKSCSHCITSNLAPNNSKLP